MRKFWISILVLVLIGGCVQKSQETKEPEEPTAEEQVDNEINQEFDFENADVFFNEYTNPTNELISVSTENIVLKGENLENISAVVQSIHLEIESEDAEKIMNEINNTADRCLMNLAFYPDDETYKGHWKTVSFFKINYFVSDHILSVITKMNSYLYEAASGFSEYKVYNLDLRSGKQLSNEELLLDFSTSLDDVRLKVEHFLQAANIQSCENTSNSNFYCYLQNQIDDISYLYCDGDEIKLIFNIIRGTTNTNVIL